MWTLPRGGWDIKQNWEELHADGGIKLSYQHFLGRIPIIGR